MKRPRNLRLRLGAGLAGMVCLAALGLVLDTIWTGLSTGRVRAKYGWMVREERPIMFDITLALDCLAAVLWIGFAILAIWVALSRVPERY